jgi:hypothetical protein
MSPLTTKSTKFEVQIQNPMKHSRIPKKPRKAQEGHLEEGKAAIPTKGRKSGKPRKRVRKSSKPKQTEQEKLKNSKLPLKSTPPNTLNVSSPP